MSDIRAGRRSAVAVANSYGGGDAIANANAGDSGPNPQSFKRPRRARTRNDRLGIANLIVALGGLLFAAAATTGSSAPGRLGALLIQDVVLIVFVLATLVWFRNRPDGKRLDIIQRLSRSLTRRK